MRYVVPKDPSPARVLTTSALLAALLAVSAIITIPIGVVPLTLQTAVLVLVALVQRPKHAALTVATYLALGLVGLPVFSGMHGGIGVLLGPTGGYLIGFLLGAVAASWVRETLTRYRSRTVADISGAVVLIAVVYAIGWLQLALVTGMGFMPALLGGVVPFLLPDALKAAAAVALAPLVRKAAGEL